MFQCPRCGNVAPVGSPTCPKCGLVFRHRKRFPWIMLIPFTFAGLCLLTLIGHYLPSEGVENGDDFLRLHRVHIHDSRATVESILGKGKDLDATLQHVHKQVRTDASGVTITTGLSDYERFYELPSGVEVAIGFSNRDGVVVGDATYNGDRVWSITESTTDQMIRR